MSLAFLGAGPARLGFAQTPTITPIPQGVVSPLDVVVPDYAVQPQLPLRPSTNVSVTYSLRPNPNSECYGIPLWPLDAILILDNSKDGTYGSMGWAGLKNSALEFIQEAGQEISDGTNRQASRFALVSTDNLADDANSLGFISPSSALSELSAIPASDENLDLSAAITRAVAMQKSDSRITSQPVLALFLRNNSFITQSVYDSIDDAKNNGFDVVLITNSAGTESAHSISSEEGLRLVTQSRYLSNPSSEEIRKVFVSLAHGKTDWLARKISITAVMMPLDALEILQVGGNFTILDGVLHWDEDHILAGQPLSLTYQARVNPNLSSADNVYITFNLKYVDCNGFEQSLQRVFPLSLNSPATPSSVDTLPGGQAPEPDPLSSSSPGEPSMNPPVPSAVGWAEILPLLKWLGIILVIGILLYLLWKFWPRKKSTNDGNGKIRVKVETLDMMPAWFRDLKALNSSTLDMHSPDVDLRETILIGLGAAGRNVLENIVSNLNNRFGEKWRSKIHVIQVDADLRKRSNSADWQIPGGLLKHEWVLLTPELQEIQDRLQRYPQDWPHLQWYEKTAPSYGRSRSRLALYFDLRDGPRTSQFWHAVESAYNHLENPVIRVIGTTFDEVSSGILVDVAFLVKRGIIRRDVDVELWLLGPSQAEWTDSPSKSRLTSSEQMQRSLATIRELERFQYNVPSRFQYVPSTSAYSQLNQVYDYAVTPTVFLFDPLARGLSHPETMREMSSALSSLLYEKMAGALSSHLSHNRTLTSGRSVVCGVGHYQLRLSSGFMDEAMAWRMVKDILFESSMGVFPLEQLQRDGRYEKLEGFKPSTLEVTREQETITRWVIAAKMGDQDDRKKLYRNVAARLGQILNGEPASSMLATQGRKMALDKAERWLKLLEGIARVYPEVGITPKLRNVQSQVSRIREWLKEEVAPLANSRWQASRDVLRNIRFGTESDIPTELEWPSYKESILLTDTQTKQYADQSPLQKLANRFGWYVDFDEDAGDWQVHLVVPPGNFAWSDGSRPDYYQIALSASQFLAALHQIALPLAQTGSGYLAVERAVNADVSTWPQKVEPLLRFDGLEASRLVGTVNHLYALGVSEGLAPAESQELANRLLSVFKTSIQPCDIKDGAVVHLLHVVDWIPLDATKIYENEQWELNPVSPSYYVWPTEQWAAGIESDASRLSVSFLRRYQENEGFITAFSLGLLYDLFTYDAEGIWTVPFMGENWKRMVPSSNPQWASRLLDMFFEEREFEEKRDACQVAWNDLIAQRRKAVAGKSYDYFRNFERNRLGAYFQNKSTEARQERDLGIFLKYLLQLEKNNLRER